MVDAAAKKYTRHTAAVRYIALYHVVRYPRAAVVFRAEIRFLSVVGTHEEGTGIRDTHYHRNMANITKHVPLNFGLR